MARNIEEPTTDERGNETHPAFGMIGAARWSSGPPGHTLFDSDVQHQHFVVVTVRTAVRKRDLNRDWIHSDDQLVQVAMSEAQWASFVSTMNSGDGVPCTLMWTERAGQVPDLPYGPRLAHSLEEVETAADKTFARIAAAAKALDALPSSAKAAERKEAMRELMLATQNASANVAFAAKSLSEHAENVVARARADIEAMVVSAAQARGLDPAEVSLALGSASPEQLNPPAEEVGA